LVGFGRVNQAIFRMRGHYAWLDVAAVVVRPGSPAAGSAVVIDGSAASLRIESDALSVFERVRPDVVIIATRSRLADVLPTIRDAAVHARLVLCTAEELAFVATDDPAGQMLDEIGMKAGSAIVPVGVNPGFLFDRLPLALTALVSHVERISVRRLVDASSFPVQARRHLGIGSSPGAFLRGVQDGTIAGHRGFAESCRTIAAGLGIGLVLGSVDVAPSIAEHDIAIDGDIIASGSVAGITQCVKASRAQTAGFLDLSLTFHASPSTHGLETQDEISIDGTDPLRVVVAGGIRPGQATAALTVHSIGIGLRAGFGYHPAGSLDMPRAWLGSTTPR
jgi:4-hydroxy-tetrahydrodipicolinate reductase